MASPRKSSVFSQNHSRHPTPEMSLSPPSRFSKRQGNASDDRPSPALDRAQQLPPTPQARPLSIEASPQDLCSSLSLHCNSSGDSQQRSETLARSTPLSPSYISVPQARIGHQLSSSLSMILSGSASQSQLQQDRLLEFKRRQQQEGPVSPVGRTPLESRFIRSAQDAELFGRREKRAKTAPLRSSAEAPLTGKLKGNQGVADRLFEDSEGSGVLPETGDLMLSLDAARRSREEAMEMYNAAAKTLRLAQEREEALMFEQEMRYLRGDAAKGHNDDEDDLFSSFAPSDYEYAPLFPQQHQQQQQPRLQPEMLSQLPPRSLFSSTPKQPSMRTPRLSSSPIQVREFIQSPPSTMLRDMRMSPKAETVAAPDVSVRADTNWATVRSSPNRHPSSPFDARPRGSQSCHVSRDEASPSSLFVSRPIKPEEAENKVGIYRGLSDIKDDVKVFTAVDKADRVRGQSFKDYEIPVDSDSCKSRRLRSPTPIAYSSSKDKKRCSTLMQPSPRQESDDCTSHEHPSSTLPAQSKNLEWASLPKTEPLHTTMQQAIKISPSASPRQPPSPPSPSISPSNQTLFQEVKDEAEGMVVKTPSRLNEVIQYVSHGTMDYPHREGESCPATIYVTYVENNGVYHNHPFNPSS